MLNIKYRHSASKGNTFIDCPPYWIIHELYDYESEPNARMKMGLAAEETAYRSIKNKLKDEAIIQLGKDKYIKEFEASEVLGIKKKIYYYKVIIPQMLRLALPNISNVWQITLKDTSLISVTGLVEIMRQSYIAAGSTRDPLFFYSFAAVLYLFLTFLSMKLFNKLEKHYNRGY